jgi:hypothetical protein
MHQLPNIMSQSTYSDMTTWIWGLSLILQVTLFIALFSRRIARSFPLFTIFIGFYLIRSILLYISFDYVKVETYGHLYNLLLLCDILVQIGLAAELCATLVRSEGGWKANRLPYVAGAVVLAALGTWIATSLMPQATIRLDRSQLLFSIIAIFVLIPSLRSPNSVLRTIAQGWGTFGIISFAASIGRVMATAGNRPHQYAAWSYALAGAYLIIVVFWLVTLRSPQLR